MITTDRSNLKCRFLPFNFCACVFGSSDWFVGICWMKKYSTNKIRVRSKRWLNYCWGLILTIISAGCGACSCAILCAYSYLQRATLLEIVSSVLILYEVHWTAHFSERIEFEVKVNARFYVCNKIVIGSSAFQNYFVSCIKCVNSVVL